MTIGRRHLMTGGGVVLCGYGCCGQWLGWRGLGSAGEMAALAARQRPNPAGPRIRPRPDPLCHPRRERAQYAALAVPGGCAGHQHPTRPVASQQPVVDPDDPSPFCQPRLCGREPVNSSECRWARWRNPVSNPWERARCATISALAPATMPPCSTPSRCGNPRGRTLTAAQSALPSFACWKQLRPCPASILVLITRSGAISTSSAIWSLRAIRPVGGAGVFWPNLSTGCASAPMPRWPQATVFTALPAATPALPDWLGPRLFDLVFTTQAREHRNIARQSRHIPRDRGIRGGAVRPRALGAGRARVPAVLVAGEPHWGLKTAHINQPVRSSGTAGPTSQHL